MLAVLVMSDRQQLLRLEREAWMPHVTFIHGLANKPVPQRLGELWQRALERDDSRPSDTPGSNRGIRFGSFGDLTWKMVYWADVFYAAPDPDESGYEFDAAELSLEGVPADKAAALASPVIDVGTGLPADEASALYRMTVQLGLDRQPGEDHFPTDEDVAKAKAGEYALERIPLPWWVKERLMKQLGVDPLFTRF